MNSRVAILAFLTFCSSMVGAWYWWRSSQAGTARHYKRSEPVFAPAQQLRQLDESLEAVKMAGRLISRAVIWTGIAAVLSAITSMVGFLADN